ncbi:hypothetical protein [Malikia granosa]|uniref:Uncharacterized protein n=1 Tax=Malikia granosa TaxID=263067 RepID=A0A2S9K9X2_9BURK|nr:hypothetical protein [Malikia granosa]PRD67175.1 hypothetical protein C6P64_00385 [Malikia granosa]
MNQTAETRQPPSFDEPLANGLTPSEIFDAVVEEFETGHTAHSSFIAEAEELVVWQHEVRLARTGSTCRIAALEYHMPDDEEAEASAGAEVEWDEFDEDEEDDDGAHVIEYLVELEIGGVFVCARWEAWSSNFAEARHIKAAAHKTYIRMAALIGVKVGYELTTQPSRY